MTSTHEPEFTPSVLQRFEEAAATLRKMSERWSALATAEEQQTLASESLTATASQTAEMSRAMAATCEAVQEVTTELRAVIDTASGLLDDNALARLRTEVQDMRQDLDAMRLKVIETLTAQLQQAVAERDATRSEAESLISESESLIKAHAAARRELEDKLAALTTEHDNLKTEHTALTTEHDNLKTEHTALATEHDHLKTEHTALRAKAEKLPKRMRHRLSTP